MEDRRRSSLKLKEVPVPWSRWHVDAVFLSVTVEQIHIRISGRLCYQQVCGGIKMFYFLTIHLVIFYSISYFWEYKSK